MIRALVIVAALLASTAAAHAATDAQRMVSGGLFPVFVNGTGTNQANVRGVYVIQTQFTPPAASTGSRMSLTGVGR